MAIEGKAQSMIRENNPGKLIYCGWLEKTLKGDI